MTHAFKYFQLMAESEVATMCAVQEAQLEKAVQEAADERKQKEEALQ